LLRASYPLFAKEVHRNMLNKLIIFECQFIQEEIIK